MLPDLIYLAATQSLELSEAGLNTVLYSDCNYTWSEQSSELFQYVKTILLYVIPFVFMFVAHYRIMRTLRISTTTSAQLVPNGANSKRQAPTKTPRPIEQTANEQASIRDEQVLIEPSPKQIQVHSRPHTVCVSTSAISKRDNFIDNKIQDSTAINVETNAQNLDANPELDEVKNCTDKIELSDMAERDNLHQIQWKKQLPVISKSSDLNSNCKNSNQNGHSGQQCSWLTTTNNTENNAINRVITNSQLVTKPSDNTNHLFRFRQKSLISVGEQKQQQAVEVQGSQYQNANKHDNGSSFCISMHNKSQLESRRNAAKMLMAIVIFFGLTHLPVHLMNFLR